MRLLLVEDEARVADFVRKGLVGESFAVDLAGRGEEALQLARLTRYDLVILDIMLPGIDGFAVCRQLRALRVDTPILILSARGLVEDRVTGLDIGADDYLTKPFAFSELSARVRALLRRGSSAALLLLEIGDLTLDPVRRMVKRGDRRLELTPREFTLLEYLCATRVRSSRGA